ncbi:MAG: hypothetical protein A2904_02560 [Candidatus Staskawiczbacteria bacterium RIFCSPLOWO2_01_FULL_33_9]|uniref:Uncharacterized protein n=1 Tax=Candidatus Staskawiczbacteria bacterium RIFCSPLOWO2_01_FULL_33_9 TaxID=1802211 RepID=A0A1G2I7J3_9BACT|nr:MAG: hypothetical protein A2904_02560 [Candidatus Staskawiczbacteria bacterium RIFCSPLOWO2_01_FULL_33_9]
MVDFQEARKDESLKQIYLDEVLKRCPKSVEAVIYDPDFKGRFSRFDDLVNQGVMDFDNAEKAKEVVGNGSNYFGIIFVPTIFGKGLKQTIYVSDKAFQKLGVEDYFLISLIDHEGFHAIDFMDGIRLPSGTYLSHENLGELQEGTFISGREIRAHKNELNSIRQKGFEGTTFFHWVTYNLDYNIEQLERISPKNELEVEVRDFFLH